MPAHCLLHSFQPVALTAGGEKIGEDSHLVFWFVGLTTTVVYPPLSGIQYPLPLHLHLCFLHMFECQCTACYTPSDPLHLLQEEKFLLKILILFWFAGLTTTVAYPPLSGVTRLGE